MTARSRWGIGGSAIALVIVVVAFSGTSGTGIRCKPVGYPPITLPRPSHSPPRKSRGSFGNYTDRGRRDGILKAVYAKEGQFVKRGTLLGEIGCDDCKRVYKLR